MLEELTEKLVQMEVRHQLAKEGQELEKVNQIVFSIK